MLKCNAVDLKGGTVVFNIGAVVGLKVALVVLNVPLLVFKSDAVGFKM